MFIFIPRSVGQLTGIKAVLALIVILAIAGFGMWASFQPHTFTSGTWELDPGRFRGATFQATQSGKVSAEFETAGDASDYKIMLINDADRPKLSTSVESIQPLAEAQGSGTLKLAPTYINAGSYAVIALPLGEKKVTVKYKIIESK